MNSFLREPCLEANDKKSRLNLSLSLPNDPGYGEGVRVSGIPLILVRLEAGRVVCASSSSPQSHTPALDRCADCTARYMLYML